MKKTKISKCLLCEYEGKMKTKSVIDNRYILMCPKCKFEFMNPIPTDEEIKNIYSKNYFGSWGIGDGETKEVANMKKDTFKHILNGITPYVKSGNILDVGTATGFLLEEAQKLGFEPYGIEISEYASSIAKSKFGEDKIYNGTLETQVFKENFFDLITMCDVIEHVKDPINTLIIANKLLRNTSHYTGGGIY
ncbi:class I SAM-dependent methyltransferase [Brachyspira sp. G79]|uniref:class I SAM-dependent methyltransferase n=1 Tax=Brachyspira sp. G79 TaxID=1358104 RepID=UPI000BBBF154|nr:class I SAM-dependent methyltransferase [Brachyspira sp. G79]